MDADAIEEGRRRWQARYDAARKRDGGLHHALRATPSSRCTGRGRGTRYEGFERIGWPGEYPYTRGLYPTGYRGRTWTIRQFAGFGNAEQTNERYKMILAAGGGGLSVAFDMPTLMGRDSDDPRSLGEVGHCGVAIDSAADMEVLFKDIPLGDVTTSMTISGPAVPVFCMYLVAAERQGVDPGVLNGTLQTDIFKEYIAQKEWLFQPEPHLRLIGDLMEYCAAGIPAYKPLSVSGYHIREAGVDGRAGAGVHPGRRLRLRGAGPVAAAWTSTSSRPACPSSSTRTSTSSRRSPSSAPRAGSGRAGCGTCTGRQTDKAQWLRFHTQTAGVSLTAQQPYNNVVRTAVEALAAVLGGTNSLHTNALDETLALPSEQAAEIALRTQQVLMEETGVANVADPLGGSWYVEQLTDRIEADAEKIFEQIKERGLRAHPDGRHPIGPITSGILRGIEDGWFTGEIAESAFQYQRALEKGDKRVVGVNVPPRLGHRRPGDPAGQPRGGARAGAGAGRPQGGARRGGGTVRAGRHARRRPGRVEHDRADAGRGPRGGDPRRDLRRAAGRVGGVHGAAGF